MQILTVDDEKEQLKSLCLTLRSNGFQTLAASSARKALDCLETRAFAIDLILTDYAMPGMDGITLVKAVKQLYPKLPVIMMSAEGTGELAEMALKNGCDGFVEKPFAVETLVRQIHCIPGRNKNQAINIKEAGMSSEDHRRGNDHRQHCYEKEGKYLTFVLEAEDYGISINSVREIIGMMTITSVPRSPEFIRGVINLRGKVIPIVDLRTRFGMKSAETTERTCIIVVEVNRADTRIIMGLVVDSVSEVLAIKGEDIEASPSFGSQLETRYILGMAKLEGGVKILLDIDRVLDNSEMEAIQDVA